MLCGSVCPPSHNTVSYSELGAGGWKYREHGGGGQTPHISEIFQVTIVLHDSEDLGPIERARAIFFFF